MLVLLITWLVSVFGVLIGASLYRGGKSNQLDEKSSKAVSEGGSDSETFVSFLKSVPERRPNVPNWLAFNYHHLEEETYLAALAEQQAQCSNFHLSAIVIDCLTDPLLKAHAQLELAAQLAHVNDINGARQVLQEVEIEPHQIALQCKQAEVICCLIEASRIFAAVDWTEMFVFQLELQREFLETQPLRAAQLYVRTGNVLEYRKKFEEAVHWWKKGVIAGSQIDPGADPEAYETYRDIVRLVAEKLIRSNKKVTVSLRWKLLHASLKRDISALEEIILQFSPVTS